MRAVEVIMILSAAGILAAPVAAQEAPSQKRSPAGEQKILRIRIPGFDGGQAAPPDVHPEEAAPGHRPSVELGWQWSPDRQHPALEYRITDSTAVRLRGRRGEVGALLDLRF